MNTLLDGLPYDVGSTPVTPKASKAAAIAEYRQKMLAKLGSTASTHAEIPELRGERHIILNAETQGLKWYDGDKPIGWSYYLPESQRAGYLPIRHDGGGNLPIEQVHSWMDRLVGMHFDNINTKFDLHQSREDGVDLCADQKNNTFGDVAFQAGLLDDNRHRFNLDLLSKDLLNWDVMSDGLGKKPQQIQDESEFRWLHSSRVEPFAIRNVMQVAALREYFEPLIEEEELDECLSLEQDVLPVVVEMEKNGAMLDVELLAKWRKQARNEYEDTLHKIYRTSGCRVESPDSNKDLEALFNKLGLPITRTAAGNASFTADVLKHTNHPVVADLKHAGHLADLLSKYLDKYSKTVRGDGWIRFQLHQLRATADPNSDDSKGTVSGRFSAAGDREGGFNPQQVVAVEKQLERGWLPEYLVRKLFIPGSGVFFAADMMQVEYRLFAHYAKIHEAFHARPVRKLIGGKWVWIQGPLADFHSLVAELLNNPLLNRKLVKNINFAMIYGAGLMKFALMLGYISAAQFDEFNKRLRRCGSWRERQAEMRTICQEEPGVQKALDAREAYLSMFPSVKTMLDAASGAVRERGYVKDLVGRRARPVGREHSALNRVIQGGAASINKRVLVEVYKQRKALGFTMRGTVHDEMFGDLVDKDCVHNVKRVLNHQYFDLRVPILWDPAIGPNWAECKGSGGKKKENDTSSQRHDGHDAGLDRNREKNYGHNENRRRQLTWNKAKSCWDQK